MLSPFSTSRSRILDVHPSEIKIVELRDGEAETATMPPNAVHG
jgi:hypothetical protein